jgi:hypothetical protein
MEFFTFCHISVQYCGIFNSISSQFEVGCYINPIQLPLKGSYDVWSERDQSFEAALNLKALVFVYHVVSALHDFFGCQHV